MAHTFVDFEPLTNVDKEVQSLYRIRDNDAEYATCPAKLISPGLIYNKNIDNWVGNQSKIGFIPVDPIWLKMTEEERIESGYPSRLYTIMQSPFAFVLTVVLSG